MGGSHMRGSLAMSSTNRSGLISAACPAPGLVQSGPSNSRRDKTKRRAKTSRAAALSLSIVPLLLLVMLATLVLADYNSSAYAQSSVRPPAGASVSASPPDMIHNKAPTAPKRGNPFSGTSAKLPPVVDPTASQGGRYDTEIWAELRNSRSGTVSIPDKNSGLLIQSDGWEWMKLRNGDLPKYGGWAMGITIALLAVFFLVKGRIRIKSGWSGMTIPRFNTFERAAHWLLAISFIILALTGLNVLYGKSLLLPLIGKGAFSELSLWAKLLHNYVAFGFIVGLAVIFLTWVWQNFPNLYDVKWLLTLGGQFSKDGHVSAKKFNAGQKILFWLVILSGLSISLSGISLLFPFQIPMFAKTFAVLNMVGAGLPTTLSPIQEMQYASTWHSIVGLFMSCLILAHIYIGTIGMQGAFAAMGSGEVDVNWAKEHHDIWAEEVLADQALKPANEGGHDVGTQPAE